LNVSDRIWVAFGCDGGFAPHLAATIASVVRYTPANRLHFLILQEGFDERQRASIQAVARGADFTWIDMAEFKLPDYQVSNHITYATLFRLGLEQLAPEACKRLIYLDADLVVMADLQELWNVDLNGATIGGIPDAGLCKDIPSIDHHWLEWVDDEDGAYMNAGVMVIDLDRVRREGGFSKALDFIAERGAALPYQDQDAINRVYWDQWTRLPLEWNVQRFQFIKAFQQYFSEESLAALKNPKIVHFTGPEKPWSMEGYHSWWWVYWQALADTPYLNQVRKAHGISRWQLFRIWLRWLKRRPKSASAQGNFPGAVFKG
jgi:lipopolysaccharide biosynthesis glycosyltransferase